MVWLVCLVIGSLLILSSGPALTIAHCAARQSLVAFVAVLAIFGEEGGVGSSWIDG